MSFLSQAAGSNPDGYDVEKKKLTELVMIHIMDCEADGVVVDIKNDDKVTMHVRFDFGESENLNLTVAEDVTQVDKAKCGFDVAPGTYKRAIHLEVEDIDLGSYDLRYKVEGFVRNSKGELVDATKHKGSAADLAGGDKSGASAGGGSSGGASGGGGGGGAAAIPPAGGSASGAIAKKGSGAGGGGGGGGADLPPSPFGDDSEAEVEEKKVNDNVTLVMYHFEGSGYEFRVKTGDKCPATLLNLDCSQSENLTTEILPPCETTGEAKLTIRLEPGAHIVPIARLTMTDEDEGGYGMSYKVSSRIDTSNRGGDASGEIAIKNKKSEEDAERERKEAADKAARIKEENERKAREEEDERKRKAEEADAKKKADEEARIEGEIARKKKAEEDASRAEDERKKRAEDREKRDAEAAEKKKKDAEAKKKADDERDEMRRNMLEKAKKEQEDKEKREAEKKRKAEEYAAERKRVADEHAAKEKVLYGEFETRKLTPFEQKEVDTADKETERDADMFIEDCCRKDSQMVPLKPEYRKVYKLYAFYKRRWEIEWSLRFKLIEKNFWDRVCSLCRDYMKPDAEITEYKRGLEKHKLHKQCYDNAPKCDQCMDILVGDYVKTTGDKPTRLHKDCVTAYKNKVRPDCTKCGKKILEDKWQNVGGKAFHTGCV